MTCLLPILSLYDGMIVQAKNEVKRLAHQRFVLHEQDALGEDSVRRFCESLFEIHCREKVKSLSEAPLIIQDYQNAAETDAKHRPQRER